jgi:hypothetical protein
MTLPDIKAKVNEIVILLAQARYADLESQTGGIHLSKDEIAIAISSYGRRLIPPPSEAFDLMEVVAVRDAKPARWSIEMPWWTLEEGRFDLSLELTLVESNEAIGVELDDLHVL